MPHVILLDLPVTAKRKTYGRRKVRAGSGRKNTVAPAHRILFPHPREPTTKVIQTPKWVGPGCVPAARRLVGAEGSQAAILSATGQLRDLGQVT